jgi:iron complex outermembrane receptor protein
MIRLAAYLRATTAALAATVTFAQPAFAQDSGTQSDAEAKSDEIIVTARRVGENLQTVPATVSVLNAEALAARQVRDLTDITRTTPNVSIEGAARSSGGGFNSSIFMRGVGQDEFLITFEPGVGTYIDGVYLGRTVGGILELSDVERVEVIKGPQGTLFGRNTIGGVVQVVSKAPQPNFDASSSLGLRSDDGVDASAMINLPISDSAIFRASGMLRKQDGFATNIVNGEDLGNVNRLVGRAQLRLLPSDKVTVDLSIDGSRVRQSGVPTSLIDIISRPTLGLFNALAPLRDPANCARPVPAGLCTITAADVSRSRGTSSLDAPSRNDADLWGTSGIITFELADNLTLKSITSYRELDAIFTADLDGTDSPLADTTYITSQNQFSQELQFSGNAADGAISFVGGLFYFRENASELGDIGIIRGLFQLLQAAPGPFLPLGPGLVAGGAGNPLNVGLDLHFRNQSSIRSSSWAIYGEASYELAPDVRVTGGLRYTRDTKRFTYSSLRAASGVFAVAPVSLTGEYDAWTPKVGIDWKASDALFLYASAARGFKSGGFNGRATTLFDFSAFEPETIWSYEGGFKSTLASGRLRLNGAIFYSDYKNIQTTVALPLPAPQVGTASPVLNAGAARIYGAELELFARLADGWTFNGSLGLLEAEYTRDTPPSILIGNRLPKAPKVQFSLGTDYRTSWSDNFDIGLGADLSRRSRQENEPSNYDPIAQPAFTLVNARAFLASPEDSWQWSIFVRNLTDKQFLANAFLSGGGTNIGYFARGREWGSSISFNF